MKAETGITASTAASPTEWGFLVSESSIWYWQTDYEIKAKVQQLMIKYSNITSTFGSRKKYIWSLCSNVPVNKIKYYVWKSVLLWFSQWLCEYGVLSVSNR